MNSLDRLAHEFAKLPGVGAKTAMRYAYAVIGMSAEDAADFSRAISDVKEKVHYCRECGNFTEDDVCEICRKRPSDVICVVTYPKDVAAMEKAHSFGGVYHVLHGTISPLGGRGADDIRIKELLARLQRRQRGHSRDQPRRRGRSHGYVYRRADQAARGSRYRA